MVTATDSLFATQEAAGTAAPGSSPIHLSPRADGLDPEAWAAFEAAVARRAAGAYRETEGDTLPIVGPGRMQVLVERARWRGNDPDYLRWAAENPLDARAEFEAACDRQPRISRRVDPKTRLVNVETYFGGNLAAFKPRMEGYKPPADVTRGKIDAFTKRAQKRLYDLCNAIARQNIDPNSVWLGTLTYPGYGWPPDPKQWKKDLDILSKRHRRRWGPLSVLWKIEPQERGAPHFHLLIFTDEKMSGGMKLVGRRYHNRRYISRWRGGKIAEYIEWLAETWCEIVQEGMRTEGNCVIVPPTRKKGKDRVYAVGFGNYPGPLTKGVSDHLKAGTSVEPVETMEGVIKYAGKYLGKECEFKPKEIIDPFSGEPDAGDSGGEVFRVGKFWGKWNGDWFKLMQQRVTGKITVETMCDVRRSLRRKECKPAPSVWVNPLKKGRTSKSVIRPKRDKYAAGLCWSPRPFSIYINWATVRRLLDYYSPLWNDQDAMRGIELAEDRGSIRRGEPPGPADVQGEIDRIWNEHGEEIRELFGWN